MTDNYQLCAPRMPARPSTLQRLRRGIERYRLPLEVQLIGHVAGDRRVMAEDGVLDHRLPRLHGLEELPQVRPGVVVRVGPIAHTVVQRFLAGPGIVLAMPRSMYSLRMACGKLAV